VQKYSSVETKSMGRYSLTDRSDMGFKKMPDNWRTAVICPIHTRREGGPGSVVGIATSYGLDGPGIESVCYQLC
jgi:hypothetical protein